MTAPSEPVRPADEETVQALAEDIKAAYYRAILDRTAGAQEAARAVVASEPWQRLVRERDEARAAVARVESLADSWETNAGPESKAWRVFGPQVVSVPKIVEWVRAALRGDAEEASEPLSNVQGCDNCCGTDPSTCLVCGGEQP